MAKSRVFWSSTSENAPLGLSGWKGGVVEGWGDMHVLHGMVEARAGCYFWDPGARDDGVALLCTEGGV